jgi:Cu2+-exporting ATPase
MPALAPVEPGCRHCGLPSHGLEFCCAGCHAAFDVIQGMGLGGYYLRRLLDPAQRALRPEATARTDLLRHVITSVDGAQTLTLAIDGLQCGACVWLIEAVLARDSALLTRRVNMTTRRLRLTWRGEPALAARFCAAVEQLGYRLVPFDPKNVSAASESANRSLLRALAVAGFAAGNVMLMSLGTWFGATQNMGPATLSLMHWVSALIAMPAVAYAGMPFFRSAAGALRAGRTNMDVPISIGVSLVTAMSLWQTLQGGAHTYFDSAVTLLFFLLIGRVLDQHARGQARATAEELLLLRAADVTVIGEDGSVCRVAQAQVAAGALVRVSMGERIGVDGLLLSERATLDSSLVTGETLPETVFSHAQIFAGSVNLGPAITLRVSATGESTLLAECVRLIEAAEQARGPFVVLADRVAQLYAPIVHICAATTFLVWWGVLHRGVSDSLMTAVAVLIITCPCALALAVPAVQVIATSRLFRAGILLKSPTALERLASVDIVVFDKTGTLTKPALRLTGADPNPDALRVAAGLAANSRHPLCRVLECEAGSAPAADGVVEYPGQGLMRETADGVERLGSRAFCGLNPLAAAGPELCLTRPGHEPAIFQFAETVKRDAPQTMARLRAAGLDLRIASGDNLAAVARIAALLGVETYRGRLTPVQKSEAIAALRREHHVVLMVGDGLNDGPCLAAADVSAAPASAANVSQTVADIVFQGDLLAPVASVIRVARRARSAMRQNLVLSIAYNALMLPLAACGYVTPWFAALAMSSSSVLVMLNSLRLQRMRL